MSLEGEWADERVGDFDGHGAEGALVHVFHLAGVAAGCDEGGRAEGYVGDDCWAWDGKSTLEGGVVLAWGVSALSCNCVMSMNLPKSERINSVVIPLVSSSRTAGGVARAVRRTKSHVSHGNLVDIVGGIHGRNKTTCRCNLAEENVSDCLATSLAWVTAPDEGTNVLLLLDEGGVDLTTTHLQDDEGFLVRRESIDDADLSAGPGDGVAVHALGLDGIVNTTHEDYDISIGGGIGNRT